jgi:hypothetical protein
MSEGQVVAYDTVSNIFSNSNLLLKIGLDIPQITTVTKKLKECGIDIKDNIYTVEVAADAIYNCIKGEKNA